MKKIIYLIISILLSFALLTACGDNPGGGTAETEAQAQNNTAAEPPDAEPAAAEPVKLLPDVPENLNLGGYKFRLIYESSDNYDWATKGIEAEEETGDAINDAAYIRNTGMTDKYNFEIVGLTYQVYNLPGSTIRRLIQAGTDDFDAVILRTGEAPALITNGSFVDLKDVPYLDFDKPWWDEKVMAQMSVAGRKFAAFGDFIVVANDALRILMFNKQMHKDNGIEDLYSLVKDGKWTLDKFYDVSKDIAFDLNGDGKMDRFDRYGILIQQGSVVCYMFGAGVSTTEKDGDDLPFVSIGDERSLNVLQRISEVFKTTNLAIYDGAFPNTWADLQVAFENSQGLFFAEVLQLTERMRSTDTDFGVLPFPKYDEVQENYYAYADCRCLNAIYIPVTNNNLEQTGQILEILTAESYYTVRPAYYDKSLNGKFMRDVESSEMLDIILTNKIISLDDSFNWVMLNAVSGALTANSPDFVSIIERNAARAENAIQRTIDAVQALD